MSQKLSLVAWVTMTIKRYIIYVYFF
uniref:Uncharacterized protein n=1 Tax=Anguilla anguilla TaxID=7936 RepID=A0A0E9T2S4_ANGAN